MFSPNSTGEYVSRIEKKALNKLREKFEQKKKPEKMEGKPFSGFFLTFSVFLETLKPLFFSIILKQ